MECPKCGAPFDGKVCSYCGYICEEEKTNVTIINNIYGDNNSSYPAQQNQNFNYVPPTSPCSRPIAILLAALGFIGLGGLHRFYTGKILTGIFYFLTFGVFFIGTILDIIDLARGKFKDSNNLVVGKIKNQTETTVGFNPQYNVYTPTPKKRMSASEKVIVFVSIIIIVFVLSLIKHAVTSPKDNNKTNSQIQTSTQYDTLEPPVTTSEQSDSTNTTYDEQTNILNTTENFDVTTAPTTISEQTETTSEQSDITSKPLETQTESYEITYQNSILYKNSFGETSCYCIVEIKNTGTVDLYLEDAVFDFEDNEGNLLGTCSGIISDDPQIISSGEKGYFYCNMATVSGNIDENSDYVFSPKLKVKKSKNDIIRYEISNLSISEGGMLSPISIIGKVKNNTDQEDPLVWVCCVLYREDNTPIAACGTNVYDLMAGETTSFDIQAVYLNSLDINLSDVASYKVYACKTQYQFD